MALNNRKGGTGMGILNPPASGDTVRMYRVGLGDCFLLAFPTGQAGQAFYMLIDCGGAGSQSLACVDRGLL